MTKFMFLSFLLLMAYLIVSFIRDSFRKGKEKDQNEQVQSSLHLIIPAIIASLVAQGLLPKEETEELDGLSFSGIEDYLLTNNIFESKEEIEGWIMLQPELVGNGDSIFGGFDQQDQ